MRCSGHQIWNDCAQHLLQRVLPAATTMMFSLFVCSDYGTVPITIAPSKPAAGIPCVSLFALVAESPIVLTLASGMCYTFQNDRQEQWKRIRDKAASPPFRAALGDCVHIG